MFGAGTQFQSDVEGDLYRVIVEAFDSLGNRLGSASGEGLSKFGLEGDNSAVFLGVVSNSTNIDKLTFQVIGSPARAEFPSFAINRLDLVSANPVASVPEPSGILGLMALGAVGAGALWKQGR